MGVTLWLSLASLCSIVTAGRIDPVLGLVGSFGLFYTCVTRKFRYLQNKGTFFLEICPETLDLDNFATAIGWRHVLSTVDIVMQRRDDLAGYTRT